MHQILENLLTKAKAELKTIVLADGDDPRVQEAAFIINKEKIAKLIIIGKNVNIPGIEVINPENNKYKQELTQKLFEIRQNKGLTLTEAQKLIQSPLYLGTMLVNSGIADGMVGGANCPSSELLRPALQIIKAAPGKNIVSSFFIMSSPKVNFGHQGLFFFADCALNVDPTAEQLAEIAVETAESFNNICSTTPKIALLSYSTHNSGQGVSVDKVKKATEIAQKLRPDILIEGEIQADTAIIPPVCSLKCPECKVRGNANILIFPNLDSGNIAYKLVQRLADFEAFGPITQGLNKPINDLSRGCNIDDIVATTAITSIQALTPASR